MQDLQEKNSGGTKVPVRGKLRAIQTSMLQRRMDLGTKQDTKSPEFTSRFVRFSRDQLAFFQNER